MSNYDNVIPKDKWEFDESVANCFENMLERSIPQYDVMRKSVTDLAYSVINSRPRKEVFQLLDVGCSDGLMLMYLLDRLGDSGYYYGVDISDSMLERAKERFNALSNVFIQKCDLREHFPTGYFDVITSILTVQFTPIEYRQKLIKNIYDSLSAVNGCFLMVEKVLGNSTQLNDLFVTNYYDMKKLNGYSKEQIDRKRLSLEGVLVPITNDWNIQLLKQVGFKQIDVFWRWMNFVGYIAIK